MSSGKCHLKLVDKLTINRKKKAKMVLDVMTHTYKYLVGIYSHKKRIKIITSRQNMNSDLHYVCVFING